MMKYKLRGAGEIELLEARLYPRSLSPCSGRMNFFFVTALLVISLCAGIYVSTHKGKLKESTNINSRYKKQTEKYPHQSGEGNLTALHTNITHPSESLKETKGQRIARDDRDGTEKRRDKKVATSTATQTSSEYVAPPLNILREHLPSPIREMVDGVEVDKQLWLLELSRLPVSDNSIALTFDAHFTDEHVPHILEVLERCDVHATFFVTGHWADTFPSTLKAIASYGHEIGNHTYSHPKLTSLSDERVVDEVKRAEQSILKAIGDKSHLTPYVRPPYGDRDKRVAKILLKFGYIPTYWSIDGLDWKKGISQTEVIECVVTKASPGDIILLHATSHITANALLEIIDGLREKGLKPCTVSELVMHSGGKVQ